MTSLKRLGWFSVIFLAVLGFVFSSWIVKRSDRQLREDLLLHAQIAVSTINQDDIKALSFTSDDLSNPAFIRLGIWLKSFAHAAGCRSLYTMIKRGDQIVFGPENLQKGDPFASPPGTSYRTPPEKLKAVFESRKAITVGPYTDEYGTFVSAFSPVIDHGTGKVIVVVGMDVEASDWKWYALTKAALPITLTILLTVLLFLYLKLQKTHSEIRNREATLLESEIKYRQLAETSHDIIVTVDLYFRITYANKAAFELTGIADPVGSSLVDFTPPHLRPLQEELMQKRREGFSDTLAFEWEIVHPDGKIIIFDIRATLLTENRKPSGVMFVARDVTERKKSEETLRAMVEMLDSAPNSITVHDEGGRFYYANQKTLSLHGYTRQEFMGLNLGYLDVPESQARVSERMRLIEDTGEASFEVAHFRKDGTAFPLEVLAKKVNWEGKPAILSIATDITERKKSEDRLKEANRRLENIIEFLPDATLIIDSQGRIISWNRAIEEMTGLPKEDILGKDHYEAMVPFYGKPGPYLMDFIGMDDGDILSRYTNISRKGNSLYAEVFTPALYQGKGAYIWAIAAPLYDKNHKLIGTIESIRDITERKRAEDALRFSEERYRTIFDNTATANIIVDEDMTILMANKYFTKLCGYTNDELEGKMSWTEVIHKDDLEKMKDYHKMRRIDQRSAPSSYEFRMINRKGEVMNLFMSVAIIPETEVSIASMVDITKSKNLETQLVQAQKMESVGRLAGGVAHDFNNMLSVIMGNTELAMGMIDPSNPLHKILQDIMNAGKRSADLTRQLLAFARKQTAIPKLLDLNDTISGMLKMLSRLIGEDIDLGWFPGHNLWNIMIDPSQMDQILANLAVNARDAIDKTGRIVIETTNTIWDDTYCSVHTECIPGEYVLMSVSDDGCGMDKETVANIFEPFFTTKKEGQGTGLGLATVYGIVRQNSGFINVYSEPGMGTTFRIYLPRHKTGSLEPAEEKEEMKIQGGTETVLIVEDDVAVLSLSKDMLEKLGYHVLAASKTEEAIRIAQEYKGNIDLLLTDVVMPDMNGKELSERICSVRPGLKCMYTSGYTADVIARQGILEEGVHFISKPFFLKDLAAKVREAFG